MTGPAGAPPALELSGIVKRFGRSVALDGASLRVRPGTVHAVLGENGAGKTTLMRVAFGMLAADSGTVAASGKSVRFRSPTQAIAAGLGMVHQHFTNVPAMTVAQNVALGGHGRLSIPRLRDHVREIGQRSGLSLDPDAIAGELPVGAQQRLEIVKALARDATVLLLDEPTAVLAPDETAQLLRWLRTFADSGGAAVLITHKLREAIAAADDVTVLRRGRTVFSGPASDTNADELARAMLGEAGEHEHPRTIAREPGTASGSAHAVVARATELELRDSRGIITIHSASFDVFANEMLGIAAVEGAGQRELMLALAGRLAPSAGNLKLPSAVGFVPEDRHRNGMILDFTLAENVALHGAESRRGRVDWRGIAARTRDMVAAFDVRGADGHRPERTVAGRLSGGNQQKLVLARELAGRPALLVAENPTRGLDIRATAAVHDRLRAARDAGSAVVVYSSDLDEVLSLADRVIVVHGGRVMQVTRDRDAVGRAMLGAG